VVVIFFLFFFFFFFVASLHGMCEALGDGTPEVPYAARCLPGVTSVPNSVESWRVPPFSFYFIYLVLGQWECLSVCGYRALRVWPYCAPTRCVSFVRRVIFYFNTAWFMYILYYYYFLWLV